jgi:hypothetical protein
MESTVSENGRERNFPATVPPIKIKVKKKEEEKSFLKKLAVNDKIYPIESTSLLLRSYDGDCNCR